MYYRQPLEPGQAFSFVNPHEVRLGHDGVGPVYVRPGDFETPDSSVLPATRLIVHDACFIMGGMWRIYSKLHEHHLRFLQRCGTEELASLMGGGGGALEPGSEPYQERYGWAVADVSWPDPTPESLMIQVRVLSCYGLLFRTRRNVHRQPPPIPWRRCQHLGELDLEQGSKLALEWLRPFVADPASALRERGFAV